MFMLMQNLFRIISIACANIQVLHCYLTIIFCFTWTYLNFLRKQYRDYNIWQRSMYKTIRRFSTYKKTQNVSAYILWTCVYYFHARAPQRLPRTTQCAKICAAYWSFCHPQTQMSHPIPQMLSPEDQVPVITLRWKIHFVSNYTKVTCILLCSIIVALSYDNGPP